MFVIVKYSEDNFKKILPPRLLKIFSIRFHYFKHDCESPATSKINYIIASKNNCKKKILPGSDIQLTSCDDRGQFKHDRKPCLHPNTVSISAIFFTQNKHLKGNIQYNDDIHRYMRVLGILCTNLRFFRNIFGTQTYDANCFHTGVRK